MFVYSMKLLKFVLKCSLAALLFVVAGCAIFYVSQMLKRPERTNLEQQLYKGVHYERRFLTEPRPVLTHILTVDLTEPTLEFMVSPADRIADRDQMNARTTTEFVDEFGPQIAINASFFYSISVTTPLSYYPKSGEPITALGLTISDGVQVSADNGMRPVCIIGRNITFELGGCPDDTEQAVSGNAFFVRDGRAAIHSEPLLDKPYSRTTVALNTNRTILWIVIVDGKQRGYSEGLTLAETAEFVIDLGANQAVNLDGGGSVTLATQGKDGARVLNAPIQARVPMWERPVANHLGIFAEPIE